MSTAPSAPGPGPVPIIPTQHRAVIYDAPGQTSTALTTLPTPSPSTGEVLIKLTHSGVCGSDHGLMRTRIGFPAVEHGQVGGHEGVGHVVALGAAASARPSRLRIGDRVGIKWVASICGTCPPCLDGRDALCHDVRVSGFHVPGTFQEYVVSPADYVTPIPEGVPSEVAAPLLCGGVTVYAALKKSGAQPVSARS